MNKLRIVSYVDGPYYPDKSLNERESYIELRNRIYKVMVERSKNSNINYIEYTPKI